MTSLLCRELPVSNLVGLLWRKKNHTRSKVRTKIKIPANICILNRLSFAIPASIFPMMKPVGISRTINRKLIQWVMIVPLLYFSDRLFFTIVFISKCFYSYHLFSFPDSCKPLLAFRTISVRLPRPNPNSAICAMTKTGSIS